MASLTETEVFNNADKIIEGWYWALRSSDLKRGRAKPLSFLGRDMVIYRGEDGRVVAMDAYCPHMGAHLAEGKVEGNSIRCLFHYWKYSSTGNCVEIPCQDDFSFVPQIRTWPIEERYGLIWIWAGATPRQPLPFPPELEGRDCDFRLANRFTKSCHPNVVMVNAIDAQHFNSVHNLPVELNLEAEEINENCILFSNTTQIPRTSAFTRFLGRFYSGPLTYVLSYWFGSTGTVTAGPDFLHVYLMFALRPTKEGRTEGQTILITRKRRGLFGKIVSLLSFALSRLVAAYFAKGDTLIFETIRFNLRTPIKADRAIIRFIQHAERQKTFRWGLYDEDANESAAESKESFAAAFKFPVSGRR